MYVCICNAVTEDEVHECMAGGARTTKQVRAELGMRPDCGSCTRRLCALVSAGRTAAELVEAIGTARRAAAPGPVPVAGPARPERPQRERPRHTEEDPFPLTA